MAAAIRFPVIIGPTAGGKTALSIALSRVLCACGYGRAEVVNADSMLVYEGLDIGCAKPFLSEQEVFPLFLGFYEDFSVFVIVSAEYSSPFDVIDQSNVFVLSRGLA